MESNYLEWIRIFNQEGYLQVLKELAFDGQLKGKSAYRSVCWKLFLGMLPEDQSSWIEATRETRRHYEQIKKKFIIDPHDAQQSLDIELNNPLSQEEKSPWNQFFADKELKRTIETDVIRTFPEQVFFQEPPVRESMMNILFCFAKENPQVSYKQGMHEILAPLLFVLKCSHMEKDELEAMPDSLRVVMDPAYFEHDAYSFFSVIMETMQLWYSQDRHMANPGKVKQFDSTHNKPFDSAKHLGKLSMVSIKLEKIHSVILKKLDADLYLKLKEMGIPPEAYGIRWIRLLFGREFPFPAVLDLWDGIFADGRTFGILDYVYVSMLRYIRKELLYADYTTCMKLLMSYPDVYDVQDIILYARHLKYPNLYSFDSDIMDVRGTEDETLEMDAAALGNKVEFKKSIKKAAKKGGEALKKFKKPSPIHSRKNKSHVEPVQDGGIREYHGNPTNLAVKAGSDNSGHIPIIQIEEGQELNVNPYKSRPIMTSNSQSEYLEQRLDDMRALCKYCGAKIKTKLAVLEDVVHSMEINVNENTEVFTAVAELKQVRDILLGELHFTGALTELNMSPKATPPSSLSPKHPQERLLFGDDQILNCVEQLSPSTSRPIPVKTETLNAEATDFLPEVDAVTGDLEDTGTTENEKEEKDSPEVLDLEDTGTTENEKEEKDSPEALVNKNVENPFCSGCSPQQNIDRLMEDDDLLKSYTVVVPEHNSVNDS